MPGFVNLNPSVNKSFGDFRERGGLDKVLDCAHVADRLKRLFSGPVPREIPIGSAEIPRRLDNMYRERDTIFASRAISMKRITTLPFQLRCSIQAIIVWSAVTTFAACFLLTCLVQARAEDVYARQTSNFAFEVASIRPEQDTGSSYNWKLRFDAGSFEARGQTVKMLLKYAYDVDDHEIVGGPSWISRQTFAINARIDSQTASALALLSEDKQVAAHRQMLQNLLAERFNLHLHPEKRSQPVYSLVTVPGRLKLIRPNLDKLHSNETNDYGLPSGTPQLQVNAGEIRGDAAMPIFVKILSNEIGHIVIDKTGLSGTYTIDLQFAPETGVDGLAAVIPGVPVIPSTEPPAPKSEPRTDELRANIFIALKEQLGLALQPDRASLDVLVVDQLMKPSED